VFQFCTHLSLIYDSIPTSNDRHILKPTLVIQIFYFYPIQYFYNTVSQATLKSLIRVLVVLQEILVQLFGQNRLQVVSLYFNRTFFQYQR